MMRILLLLFCSVHLSFCSFGERKQGLIGSWQLCAVETTSIDAEEAKFWKQQLAEGIYKDEMIFKQDSTLTHRFKKRNDKWTDMPGRYILSSDRKILQLISNNQLSFAKILLLTSDSLKIESANKNKQTYFRKDN